MVKRFYEILIIFIVLQIAVSCQISKPEKETGKEYVSSKTLSPVEKLSIELSNTLGFELKDEKTKFTVWSLQPDSPAGVAGLKSKMLVTHINNIDLKRLDDDGIKLIIEKIFAGNCPVNAIDSSGKKIEFDIHYGRDNCPQKLATFFWFVEIPQNEREPSVLFIQILREIRSVTFERKKMNRIELFDNSRNRWFEFHESNVPFENGVDPSDIAGVISEKMSFSSQSEIGKGTIGFTGDFSFSLDFDLKMARDDPDYVYIGDGVLKINGISINGYVLSRHVIEKMAPPFQKKKAVNVSRKLDENARHVEDRVEDWLVLFDINGNAVEIDIDGMTKTFWGVIYPNQNEGKSASSCFTTDYGNILNSLTAIWFDGVVEGKEADPFPAEIKLESPEFQGKIVLLKGLSPQYNNEDNTILSVILYGDCGDSKNRDQKVFGYLKRFIYSSI